MAKDYRRNSTLVRHNLVHKAYNDLKTDLGIYANLVPKSYIYEIICKQTGLCSKTVAYILNHTDIENNLQFGGG